MLGAVSSLMKGENKDLLRVLFRFKFFKVYPSKKKMAERSHGGPEKLQLRGIFGVVIKRFNGLYASEIELIMNLKTS